MGGRAKRIQEIMNRAGNEYERRQQQEPPVGGRASRLAQYREQISGHSEAGHDLNQAQYKRPRSNEPGPSSARDLAIEVDTLPLETYEYRGRRGKQLPGTANYIRLRHKPNQTISEYDVEFEPAIDSKKLRSKLLYNFVSEIGNVFIYNGRNLFVPRALQNPLMTLVTINPATDAPVEVRFELKRHRRMVECIFIYNLLFRKIMYILEMKRINRSNFDPRHPQLIPQHKLEIWPGYVTAIDEYNGGLLLCLDCCFKVLNTQTVLELMTSIRISQPQDYQRLCSKALIGQSVLTRYNNRNYVIEEILWDSTPRTTFEMANGRQVTYLQYYKEHYNIDIHQVDQPLLLNRQNKFSDNRRTATDTHIIIIPELSYMTGLRDEMRSDMRVMKDVATFTRLTPNQRMNSLRNFMQNVNTNQECVKLLSDWNLTLENATIDLSLRVLDPETILFGRGATAYGTQEADWGMASGKSPVFEAKDISNWACLYNNRDRGAFEQFKDTFVRQGPFLGIRINQPTPIPMYDDRTEAYVTKLKEVLRNNVQCVVIMVPSQREDRYSAIKKVCCVDMPIPSQVVQVRTLSNPKRHRSVVQKIVLQVNCKLGGSLWAVKIPFKNWMICGIDVYHTKDVSGQSVVAFVSTINDTCTRWYSTVSMNNRNEISNGLQACFQRALREYQSENNEYPSYVVIFRDGVGDGQLNACLQFEIPQLQKCLDEVQRDPRHNGSVIDLCFVVVQKRINTRFFAREQRDGFSNPPPGTVLDFEITRKHYNDFFLVSQHVRQGTINPVHYIVLSDTKNTDPDRIQLLTFKMCHLYYNWPGTIRVPAPCQYAHKFAYLIGQNVRKIPAAELSNRLYYL